MDHLLRQNRGDDMVRELQLEGFKLNHFRSLSVMGFHFYPPLWNVNVALFNHRG